MDAEDLLDRMQDKISIAVANGVAQAMKEHREQEHNPLWAELKDTGKTLKDLNLKVAAWGGGLTVATAALEIFRRWHP